MGACNPWLGSPSADLPKRKLHGSASNLQFCILCATWPFTFLLDCTLNCKTLHIMYLAWYPYKQVLYFLAHTHKSGQNRKPTLSQKNWWKFFPYFFILLFIVIASSAHTKSTLKCHFSVQIVDFQVELSIMGDGSFSLWIN